VDVSGPEHHLDDEESADAAPVDDRPSLDVTPRTSAATRSGGSGARKYLAIGGVVVLLGALGLVVFNGLNDAATFYYNVDEAVQEQDSLGDQRFRMQGNVVPDSIVETDDGVDFVLAYRDVEVPVQHLGDPPELFSSDIPVIIEGNFDGDHFASDEILIRHDSTYEEENGDRLREAQDDADRRASEAG
jgi:cytochrome c-type biogenesis protein CcmE